MNIAEPDNTNSLPPALVKDLMQNNLEVKTIIFTNPRKGRWTLKVHNNEDGTEALMKWCHPETEGEHRQSFCREQQFYRDFGCRGFTPQLIRTSQRILLLEYVESVTLRQYLLAQDRLTASTEGGECEEMLRKLTSQLAQSYSRRKSEVDFSCTAEHLSTFWSKLLLSGPMGTCRPRVEGFVATIIVKTLKRRVRRKFQKILEEAYASDDEAFCTLIHGDLHCNNILVDKFGGRVLFIDFENCKEDYFWMLDLLYLWPMVMALLCDTKENLKRCVGIVTDDPDFPTNETDVFTTLCLLMGAAAMFNSRFSPERTSFIKYAMYLQSLLVHLKFIYRGLR